MTQRTHWIPEHWRDALAHLRDDIHDIVERWLPRSHGPGTSANANFAVEITGERLMIRGEKKHESRRSGRGYRYQERHYGALARVLRLPCEVDADKAQANYRRGVLRVTLPKTERAKAKQVEIQGHE